MSDLFAFEVYAEGVVTCDGEKCNDECPIHDKEVK